MSRMARASHFSHDRWLVSYADFITLLFAFFVVLYASSKADEKKQVQAAHSIESAFRSLGIFADAHRKLEGPSTESEGADKPVIPMSIVMSEDVLGAAEVKEDLDKLHRELQQRLSNQIAHHTVAIKMGHDGLVISLREAGFFDSGSANPHPEAIATLRQVADSLSKTPYDLRIEGHTDNVAIRTAEFDSNWELSAARATRVARILLEMKAILPDRLSAAGYAEFHPVASNETLEGRAENRRVDLVILPRSSINLSAPDAPAPSSTDSTGTWQKITDYN